MDGVALALLAAFMWGIAGILVRVALVQLQPTTGTVISLFAGFTMTMGLAVAFHPEAFASLTVGLLASFAFYGLLNFPLGRFFNYSSIRLLGVSRATPIFSAAPLVSMILAVTLLGERLTLPLVIGALAVMAGVILIVSDQ